MNVDLQEAARAACYTEASVYAPGLRVRRQVLRLLGRWRRQDYDVRVIYADGEPDCKKVVFQCAERARQAYADMDAFGRSPHFPELVEVLGNALTVTYLQGRPVQRMGRLPRETLSDFYAAVYARAPQAQPFESSQVAAQFERNLVQLQELRVLRVDSARKLRRRARRLAPDRVWTGFDYTDPIQRNFLLCGEPPALCAVDIKNLRSDTLMGQGIAKARRRWLTAARTPGFLRQLQAKGTPDFAAYFPFIQLFDDVQRITNKMVAEAQLRSSRKLRLLQKNRLSSAHFMD